MPLILFRKLRRSLVGKQWGVVYAPTAVVSDREAFQPLRRLDLMGKRIRDAGMPSCFCLPPP